MNTLERLTLCRRAALHLAFLASVAGLASGQQVMYESSLLEDLSGLGYAFGESVAMTDSTVIVGDSAAESNGNAHLFNLATGQELDLLTALDGSDNGFGHAVGITKVNCSDCHAGALSEIAIVGAPYDDDNGSNSGSAYLFNVTTGQQYRKLLPNDGAIDHSFGRSVAISGTTAIVGAECSAYLFDALNGQQVHKLLPNPGESDFGKYVAISGNTAIVGGRDYAYVFDVTSGEQIQELLLSDGVLGGPLAISGTTAIVASRLGSSGAYLFDVTTGKHLHKLLPSDDISRLSSVAIDGSTAIVAADWSDTAYVFDVSSGKQLLKLLPSDHVGVFGASAAISGNTAVVGRGWDAWSPDEFFVYVFQLPPLGQNYCGPAVPNSSGQSAEIHAEGERAAAANDLTLTASKLPPNRPGYFLVSQYQGFWMPVGSVGYCCLGAPWGSYWSQMANSGPMGQLELDIDLNRIPVGTGSVSVLAGDTWNFQCVFQDVIGNQVKVLNFTDAISITFL